MDFLHVSPSGVWGPDALRWAPVSLVPSWWLQAEPKKAVKARERTRRHLCLSVSLAIPSPWRRERVEQGWRRRAGGRQRNDCEEQRWRMKTGEGVLRCHLKSCECAGVPAPWLFGPLAGWRGASLGGVQESDNGVRSMGSAVACSLWHRWSCQCLC